MDNVYLIMYVNWDEYEILGYVTSSEEALSLTERLNLEYKKAKPNGSGRYDFFLLKKLNIDEVSR